VVTGTLVWEFGGLNSSSNSGSEGSVSLHYGISPINLEGILKFVVLRTIIRLCPQCD